MQTGVLVVVLGFLVLFAAMTFEVISRTGFDILSVLALLFIAMMAIPLIAGLLGSRPDDD
jgi:p-aminobenzoyl-glutamate transporter AbgT